jgi:RimJ/RimL family protein N-acetyltransferase
MAVELRTPRLVLRPPENEDAARIAALADNYEIARMLTTLPSPYGIEDAITFLDHQANERRESSGFHFAITLAGDFIGMTGVHRIRSADFEFGYWLGASYWGKGYATEAGRALLAYAFETLELERIVSGHFMDNPDSGRVLQKLGFRYTGFSMRHCRARGGEVLSRNMALERSQWKKS